jgi:sugar lactone lactonase YvrE
MVACTPPSGSGTTTTAPTGASRAVVTTLAGYPGRQGVSDGPGALGQFINPASAVVDPAGNLFVADQGADTIRKVTPDGVVSTVAGQPGVLGDHDGPGATATFGMPSGITRDHVGNLFVTNRTTSTIRKITPDGEVSTFAGASHTIGTADGTGAGARFETPVGIAIDGSDNLYVTDLSARTVRKITPAAEVTTLAGLADVPGSQDGAGGAARFQNPIGIAVDGSGTVYVSDELDHTIRKITAGGVVTTLAGYPGEAGATDAVGTYARFNFPYGLAATTSGTVYVADHDNHTIRKIAPDGTVSTVAGYPLESGTTDGAGTYARFHNPRGVAIGPTGVLYVADYNNSTIRKITGA